jgi:pyruvate dehydrogenase E1 component beta subunit
VAREAAERLAADKKADVEVVDVRTIAPCDYETIVESAKRTGRAVVVHEAPRTGGFGAEISAQITERAILHLQAPVLRVTGFDTMPPLAKLEGYYQPGVDDVIKAVMDVMAF